MKLPIEAPHYVVPEALANPMEGKLLLIWRLIDALLKIFTYVDSIGVGSPLAVVAIHLGDSGLLEDVELANRNVLTTHRSHRLETGTPTRGSEAYRCPRVLHEGNAVRSRIP